MQVLDEMYHKQYHQDALQPNILTAFDIIADEIVKQFEPKTACDVGCSGGALLRGLRERGVDAFGIDGAPTAKEITWGIKTWDLRERMLPCHGFRFGMNDIVTCFDVAEHIEAPHADDLCFNLNALCDHWLIFGAAGPRQEGHGHVNLQPQIYWIDKLQGYGFDVKGHESMRLKRAISSREEHGPAWWVAENLMVFWRR